MLDLVVELVEAGLGIAAAIVVVGLLGKLYEKIVA
jgi:hypothetical protein